MKQEKLKQKELDYLRLERFKELMLEHQKKEDEYFEIIKDILEDYENNK